MWIYYRRIITYKLIKCCYFKHHVIIIRLFLVKLSLNCSQPGEISNPLKPIARIPFRRNDDFVAVVVIDVVQRFAGRTNKVMAPSFLSLNGCLGFGVWTRPPRYSCNRLAFLLLVVQKEETSSQPPA